MPQPSLHRNAKFAFLKPRLLLAAAVVLLLLAAVALKAWHGHGRLHALAKSVYLTAKKEAKRVIKGESVQAAVPAERADAPLVIYDDALGDGWQDWSWGKHTIVSPITVHAGKAAMLMPPGGNRGLYLHHDSLGTGGYGTLQFWMAGDTTARTALAGDDLKFSAFAVLSKYLKPDPARRPGWHLVQIPLSVFGAPREGESFTGIVFQPDAAAASPLSIDEVSLLPDLSLAPAPTQATVAVTVNVGGGRHPISPFIYGMAFAPDDYLADLKLGVNRWGGNDKSRYNWVNGNADNAARDWSWRNRWATDGSVPPGPSSAADRFVSGNKARAAATLLTVPTLGWVAADSDNTHKSDGVPSAGGAGLNGSDGAIKGYDPAANRALTSVPSRARKGAPFTDPPVLTGTVSQDEWVAHLKNKFGDASHGGVQFLAMDNEPDLWDATQTDVHPARMGYDDVLRNFLDYSTAVKDVDPSVLVTGPVSWGWPGYMYSALDRGDDNFKAHADRSAHGETPFLPWFLAQVHAHDAKAGRRTLDVLDVHYYPQENGVYSGRADNPTRALRLRSTRSLWDPAYTDESWIGTQVRLVPRLKEWVAQNYPGTRVGITEWNFGGDNDITGGLATADVLGIWGREDVYLANYWAYPPKNSPPYLAFKLFRNADGGGHGFGDVACAASSPDPDKLSVYAATDSRTGDLTLVLLNKMPKATVTAPLTLAGGKAGGPVKMWRFSADTFKASKDGKSGALTAFPPRALPKALTLPPYSVTLLRVPLAR